MKSFALWPRLACLAFGLGLVICACPGEPDLPFTYLDFCQQRRAAECAFAFRCCNAAERSLLADNFYYGSGGTDEHECIERSVGLNCMQRDAAVRGGRASWDEAAARGCLEKVSAAATGCDVVAMLGAKDDPRCAPAVQGLAQIGEYCSADFECGADGYCAAETQTMVGYNPVIIGTCNPRHHQHGESCDDGVACAAGLVCTPELSTSRCLPPRVARVGEACAPYSSFVACEEGAYCGNDNRCHWWVDLNGKCDSSHRCGADAVCTEGRCQTPSPPPDPTSSTPGHFPLGAACDWHDQCASKACHLFSMVCVDPATLSYDLCRGNSP